MNGRYTLYRATNPDGSTRDVAIGMSPDGKPRAVILEGKTGGSLTVTLVPNESADFAAAESKVTERVESLLKAGYVRVGDAVVRDRRIVTVDTQGPANEEDFHWEVMTPVPAGGFLDAMIQVANGLGEHPLPGTRVTRDDLGITVIRAEHAWSFGHRPSSDGTIDARTGRGGGTIAAHHGPIPVLVLAAVARRLPGHFKAADNAGEEIGLGFGDLAKHLGDRIAFDVLRQIAERVGLRTPGLSSYSVKSTGMWI